jgi:ribosomal protein S6--L-glutamate ligase
MRVAVLGEPAGWHVGRLVHRLAALGHAAEVVRWHDLGAAIDAHGERFAPPPLDDAQAVVVRGMPGGAVGGDRLEPVVLRMDVLARLAARGTAVVNQPRALEAAIDKYLAAARLAAAGLPVPRCRAVQGRTAAERAWHELGGDCVLKPIFGSRGRGVVRIREPAGLDEPTAAAERLFLLQEFVPHGGWDVRILTVGDRAFAMRRRAAAGDWRTNVALGGVAEPFDPPAAWVDLAFRAARCLETEVAGVDLLPATDGRVLVLEVNGVPGWRALEDATGQDVTGAVADYVVAAGQKAGA